MLDQAEYISVTVLGQHPNILVCCQPAIGGKPPPIFLPNLIRKMLGTPTSSKLITETQRIPRPPVVAVQGNVRHRLGRFQGDVVVLVVAKAQAHGRR